MWIYRFAEVATTCAWNKQMSLSLMLYCWKCVVGIYYPVVVCCFYSVEHFMSRCCNVVLTWLVLLDTNHNPPANKYSKGTVNFVDFSVHLVSQRNVSSSETVFKYHRAASKTVSLFPLKVKVPYSGWSVLLLCPVSIAYSLVILSTASSPAKPVDGPADSGMSIRRYLGYNPCSYNHKLTLRPRIASTTIKLISKSIIQSIFLIN